MKERSRTFGRDLLISIFVSASENGELVLPKFRECLLEETVSGTLNYIGRSEIFRKRDFSENKKTTEIFHRDLNNRLEWLKNSRYLDQDMSIALYELAHSYRENYQENPPSDPYNTQFYNILKNEFEEIIFHSSNEKTSIVRPEIISNVRERVIPSFTEEQQRDIAGIGNSMRQYITEDLEYLCSSRIYNQINLDI